MGVHAYSGGSSSTYVISTIVRRATSLYIGGEQLRRLEMRRKPKVLFFSTGSAVRSQMAEGFLRRISGDQVEGQCTAVRPESNPLAKEVMREVGVDISEDEPKEIKELFQEYFTFVITLSDDAKERSQVWPFTRNLFQ